MAARPHPDAKTKNGVDIITQDDLAIFTRARSNANFFTNHYMRSLDSGTYWRHKDKADPTYSEKREQVWQ